MPFRSVSETNGSGPAVERRLGTFSWSEQLMGIMEAPNVRVRPVTVTDKGAWLRLRSELWPNHSIEDLTTEVDSFLKGRELWKFGSIVIPFLVVVAEPAGEDVVGFLEASLHPFADKRRTATVGYLEGDYVAPEWRRRGIGGALGRAAEAWARSRGCREMASDAHAENRLAEQSHTALGYEEVERLIHFRRELD